MCKRGNAFSLAVLIGRGLDHGFFGSVLFFLPFIQFSGYKKNKCSRRQGLKYAPLAQLVEHLTLNQGVPGSNP
jgi:hypothetical protein